MYKFMTQNPYAHRTKSKIHIVCFTVMFRVDVIVIVSFKIRVRVHVIVIGFFNS